MKIKFAILVVLILICGQKIFSEGIWVPTPPSPLKGLTVQYVVYDLRQGKNWLQVSLSNGKNYWYPFTPSDPISLSKANVFYSTFMTARSTSEYVSVAVNDTTSNTIISVQLGPNP